MLNRSPLTTMLPVRDMDRAKDFYEHRLGLEPKGPRPDGRFDFKVGTNVLELFPKDAPPADYTALSFEVSDINGTIHELEDHGVIFEDYDMPGLKTENHISVMGSEKAAWFKDSEGNYLCVHEEMLPDA